MKFDDLDLDVNLLKALKDLEFDTLTDIQELSISKVMSGKDVLAISKTGSGKTLSFVLPILNKFLKDVREVELGKPRCVILSPTRELAIQIGEDIDSLTKYVGIKNLVLFGGVNPLIQLENLKEKYDIIVATPKRLIDLVNDRVLNLDDLECFVIDEADKVIKANKRVDLRNIIRKLPYKRQTLFFSATFEQEVKDVAFEMLDDFEHIEIKEEEVDISKIEQYVLYLNPEHKDKLLVELLSKKEIKSAIVFANSKRKVDDVVRVLTANKVKSEALHSSKSNTHRMKVVDHIKSKHIKYLVATDLASRGLDIDDITHVINYDIPHKPEDYVHRIGRTGRMDNNGVAFTFCLANEKAFLNKIEKLVGKSLQTMRHTFHSELARKAGEKHISSRAQKALNKKGKGKKGKR